MTNKYDKATDTWDIDIGTCPFCTTTLYENEGLKHSNCLKVKAYEVQIILVCDQCVGWLSSDL
jgi:hypothetical protein